MPPKCLCWQGEDACFPVVISVAMSQKAVATVVRGNRAPNKQFSPCLQPHKLCNFKLGSGTQDIEQVWLKFGQSVSNSSCGSHESSEWARKSIIFARNVETDMHLPQERRAWPGLVSKPRNCLRKTRLYREDRLLTKRSKMASAIPQIAEKQSHRTKESTKWSAI